MVQAAIRFVAKEGLFLFVDGVRDDEYFSYNDRLACLKRANQVFDNELLNAAEKYKHTPYGAFLWCYSAVFLRSENITYLIRTHFIQQLIFLLAEKPRGCIVHVETWYPKVFLEELKHKKIDYKVNQILFLKYGLRERAKLAYKAAIDLKKNLAFVFKKPNPSFEGILIDANRTPTSHRLDDLENWDTIPYKKRFFSGQEHKMSGFGEGETVVFRRELSVHLLLVGIFKTLRVGLFLLKAKRKISGGLASYLPSMFDIRLLDLLLYGLAVERYLKKSVIKHIVHVSTMTKPTYRLLMEKANQNGIPVTLVSSRSLKALSSSELLLKCDIQNYSRTSIPDFFVLRDRFSTRVFDQYQDILKAKTFIGGRFKQQSINITRKPSGKGVALLIMFTHIERVCMKIIDEIKKLPLDKSQVQKVYFRSHPAFSVPIELIKQVINEIPVYDISGKSYKELENYKIIAVSGPTTGALEAVSLGSIVLWIPYVWSDGILLDEFMNTIGVKCENSEKLKKIFNEIVQQPELLHQLISESQKIARNEFCSPALISSCAKEIIKKSNNTDILSVKKYQAL